MTHYDAKQGLVEVEKWFIDALEAGPKESVRVDDLESWLGLNMSCPPKDAQKRPPPCAGTPPPRGLRVLNVQKKTPFRLILIRQTKLRKENFLDFFSISED